MILPMKRPAPRRAPCALVFWLLAAPAGAGTPAYFGFSWLHNPHAASTPYAFANIDVRPVYVSDAPGDATRVSQALYESYGVSSVLGFNDFLYGESNASATVRPDAMQLFDDWWAENGAEVQPPWVVALWPADEALERCSTSGGDVEACLKPYYAFVRHVHDLVAPNGVTLVDSFGAGTVSGGLLAQEAERLVDAGITWFGYHQYYVLHPLTDPVYRANVTTVKSLVDARAAQGARFLLVGDGFHAPWGHLKSEDGHTVPWDWSDHAGVVEEDYQIACESDAVALILFNWPDYTWLGEVGTLGSESFGNPARCVEQCIGTLVKHGEDTCGACARRLRRVVRRPQ
jgi:hypothetical protein